MDYKKRVLEHQNITIKKEWNGGHYDYEVGEESSADGYDLYYFKEKGEQYDLCENVYSYDSGLLEALESFIENHSQESITIVDFCDKIDEVDWDELAENLNLTFDYEEEEEVVELWVENELDSIKEKYEKDGVINRLARKGSFNNFTDGLCKNGEISEEMYNNICLPDEYLK
tara:strand:+ start:1888 stop:2403 length:516 start_codon:yes stop_codon:yes gene_type:complete